MTEPGGTGVAQRRAELIGDSAELIVVPRAGHSVNPTRTQLVDRALLELPDRVEATDAGHHRPG